MCGSDSSWGRPTRLLRLHSTLTPASHVPNQERQRGRGHAIDAAGLADGARADRLEFLACFVGQALDARIVDLRRQYEALIAPKGGNIGRLAGEIHVVFGVDLQLRGDLRGKLAQARPDVRELLDPQIRV